MGTYKKQIARRAQYGQYATTLLLVADIFKFCDLFLVAVTGAFIYFTSPNSTVDTADSVGLYGECIGLPNILGRSLGG